MTGSFQAIVAASKTVETGGVERAGASYTYYCAEEPTSIAPATSAALIVEPGVEQGDPMEYDSPAACEAEYLSFPLGHDIGYIMEGLCW